MTGDQADMVARIRGVLPARWFGDEGTTPVLDAVLNGFGAAWAWAYALLTFVRQQVRLSSSAGVFVDLWASSWFGTFPRNAGEIDAAYIARIKAALFPIRGTRPSFIAAVTSITGSAPLIVEPMNAGDTKGWGDFATPAAGGGYGYDSPGLYWGSLILPGQFFVTSTNQANEPDAVIYSAEQAALPAGVTAWTQLPD